MRIDDATVSRHHARIVIDGSFAALEDLGSKNGTFLREKKVASVAPLADGDAIKLGSVTMSFRVFDRPMRSTSSYRNVM